MTLARPNKSEALYGFLGGLFVAVIAALISLIPWIWPNIDVDDRLRESVETGFEQFHRETDPKRKIAALDQIDGDLKRSWAVNRLELSSDYRSEIEEEIERQQAAEFERQRIIEEEKQKLEAIRLAEIAATEAREKVRLEAERQAVLEAERKRRTEEQRLADEKLRREEEAEERRREQMRLLEEQRKADALKAEQQWQAERFCRNTSCTDWILR